MQLRAIFIIMVIVLIISFSTYSEAVSISSTSITTYTTTTETQSSVNGYVSKSPEFLTNNTIDLVIPSGKTFTITSVGYGSATYGVIQNKGTLVINDPLVIYGSIINNGNIQVNSVLALVNSSDSSSSTFLNNTGSITITGQMDNGAIINNNLGGSISNNGIFHNCISGNNFTSQFNNKGTYTGNPVISQC